MIFAFISDIHLSRYSQDKIEDTNLPERLNSIKNSLYEVGNYCRDNSIKNIFIGGDILHGKSVIYAIAQDILLQFLKDFSDIGFYIIDGNHDLSGKGEDVVSALRPLENIKNVVWIPYNKILQLEEDGILFVPYSYNMEKIIKSSNSKILISHFGLSEGILNSGMSIISSLSLKDLRGRYRLALLGHYHKPQEIIEPEFSLYYGGSTVQLDWGEKNDQKRFLIVDSDTLEVQSIPINCYRKHIELEITKDNVEDVKKILEEIKNKGDHLKVVLKDKIDLGELSKEITIVDKTSSDITNRGITSSMSDVDKINKYIEIKEIPEEQRELYRQVALEIINECE